MFVRNEYIGPLQAIAGRRASLWRGVQTTGSTAQITAAKAFSAIAVAVVWQGFSYEWLHHIAGFETPHRLGTFASMFTNASLVDDGAAINATFVTALSV